MVKITSSLIIVKKFGAVEGFLTLYSAKKLLPFVDVVADGNRYAGDLAVASVIQSRFKKKSSNYAEKRSQIHFNFMQ